MHFFLASEGYIHGWYQVISSLDQFSTALWLYYVQLGLMLTIVNVHERKHVQWENTICTMKNDVDAHAATKELENDLVNMSLVCGIGDFWWI